MLLKNILILIFIIKSQQLQSFKYAYSLNTPISSIDRFISGSTQNDIIGCDSNFTKCVVKGVLLLINQTNQQFYVASYNPCHFSQISKDGRVHLCQTSVTSTPAPGSYQVIINPEQGHSSVQTIISNRNIILSTDGRWLIDQKSNNSIALYKWSDVLGIFQSSQNISAQGSLNLTFYYKLFAPNSEYLITYQNNEVDLFLNQGGNFSYKQTLKLENTFPSPFAQQIIISQNTQQILMSSVSFINLLQYSLTNQTISVYQNVIESLTGIRQIRASGDLGMLIVTKYIDSTFDVYKKDNQSYYYLNTVPGIPDSYASYLSYDGNYVIRSTNNGSTLLFYIICQISGCTKCAAPNVCSECLNQAILFINQQNGTNITSCKCTQKYYTMSQTIHKCVECQVQNCLRCDKKGQCALYDIEAKITLEIVLLTLVVFFIAVMLAFIVFFIVKLNKLSQVHPQNQKKQASNDQNLKSQQLKFEENKYQTFSTKMHLQKDGLSIINAQMKQSQNVHCQSKAELIDQKQNYNTFQQNDINAQNQSKLDKKKRMRLRIQQIPEIDFVSVEQMSEH